MDNYFKKNVCTYIIIMKIPTLMFYFIIKLPISINNMGIPEK